MKVNETILSVAIYASAMPTTGRVVQGSGNPRILNLYNSYGQPGFSPGGLIMLPQGYGVQGASLLLAYTGRYPFHDDIYISLAAKYSDRISHSQ